MMLIKIIPFAIVTIILLYAAIRLYMAQTRAAVNGDMGNYMKYYAFGGVIVAIWIGVAYLLFRKEIEESEKNSLQK
jgi:hypothetical protein